ncbi:MAG: DsbA family protein [Alteromonadaceae bacterium]|nr:DsbA family protein [Alteromonadaceae bacterium]
MWLVIKWFQSGLRRYLRTFWYANIALRFKKTPVAEVYLSLSDPYSFMLVQVLPLLACRFKIEFKLFLVYGDLSDTAGNISLWNKWAFKDANHLAAQYDLLPVKNIPSQQSLLTGQQMWQFRDNNIEDAINIFRCTWYEEFPEHFRPSTPVMNHQIKNQQRQVAKGHYLAATIYFFGEWYWGIDRLSHLERKLIKLGKGSVENQIYFEKNIPDFYANVVGTAESVSVDDTFVDNSTDSTNLEPSVKSIKTTDQTSIDVFVSLRSPYSYLGFIQAQKLSQYYQIPLNIKPVLPMMMRGLSVPKPKQRYIFIDALREAQNKNIPFNNFSDPLGQGVVNCYKLFAYARQKNLAEAYMKSMFEAVYVHGIDLAIKANVEIICRQVGFDYQDAVIFNEEYNWQSWVNEYQKSLAEMGFWGVPCFRFEESVCWGQDRLWLIEQALLNKGK